MQGETLDRWARRTPPNLRAASERPARDLHQRFGPKVLSAIRAATPVRTGELRRSWFLRSSSNPNETETVTSEHPAARQLEHGGRIQGRPWLAVPIAVDAQLLKGPRSDGHKLFVLRSEDGRLFLATKAGGNIELRWRLMRSVNQRARPFALRAFLGVAREVGPATLRGIRVELTRAG